MPQDEHKSMKILVGTLYSGENEYEACLTAIRAQADVDFDHLVIESKPELEAHRLLFTYFLERSAEFELLVKVDADTVLSSPYLFKKIIARFEADPGLEVLSIALHDFFTDELINGLQIYRKSVRWNLEQDTIFPDIPLFDPRRYYYDVSELAPAGEHCPNPSYLQAFRYGVHRGLKSIQKIHSTTHWANMQKVWRHFLVRKDKRLGLAVLGAELVYAGVFGRDEQNYTNPKMDQALARYLDFTSDELKREIHRLRLRHWGFLPSDCRRKVLRYLRGKLGGRWDK
jgi:hypothetical protein